MKCTYMVTAMALTDTFPTGKRIGSVNFRVLPPEPSLFIGSGLLPSSVYSTLTSGDSGIYAVQYEQHDMKDQQAKNQLVLTPH